MLRAVQAVRVTMLESDRRKARPRLAGLRRGGRDAGVGTRESFCLRQRDAQDIWLAALVEAMAQQLFGWHSTARLTHLACEVVVRGQAAVGLACGSTRNLSTDHVTEYTLALNRACRPPPCCLRWFDERLELATLPDGKGLAHRRLLLLWTSP